MSYFRYISFSFFEIVLGLIFGSFISGKPDFLVEERNSAGLNSELQYSWSKVYTEIGAFAAFKELPSRASTDLLSLAFYIDTF